jgi:hypothetical protein
MTTNPENQDQRDEILLGDLFRPLIQYRRLIWQGTIGAVAIAFLLGALYFFLQPSAWSAGIGFRPVFEGADAGRYPNGLPFAPTDIADASVVAQVFARNGLEQYCNLDGFQGGLSVQESSSALQALNAEYQARLSDARLTTVDRQRLQDEFAARRAAMPREYKLMFVRPADCASLPQPLVLKALAEVLETWATDSQARRGVLNVRAAVLSPEIFVQPDTNASPLVRADLVRAAIVRVLQNISVVQNLPGAELVRAGKIAVTFAEVRQRLEDLMQARLDPLIRMAGRGFGRESISWVTHSLETATTQLRAAEARAEAYRQALREYSGVPQTPTANSGAAAGRSQSLSDVQALTPQIDRTFIEGIVALSATNTAFRQEITRNVITASVDAVNRGSLVEHYRNLLAAMKDSSGNSLSVGEVERQLEIITAEAKDSTQLFNDIYNEFSRVAFRAGSALYRVEQPAQVTVLKAFSLRDYVLLVIGVLVGAPVLLALACLILFHLRRYVKSTVTS